MQKVLVIVGPTSSGKSNLAIELAKEFDGEIISGDSIQVYRGLDIGSAKISLSQKEEVTHHLLDILHPEEEYSVAHFQKLARQAISEIIARGKLPILCGGTGLYIRACLYDYSFLQEEEKDCLFEELSNEELYQRLQEVDPNALQKIHVNNRKRLLRAYNVYQKTGKPFSQLIEQQKHDLLYNAKIVGIEVPRDQLYKRINQRAENMVMNGLRLEIENLLAQGITFDNLSMQGIGYREYRDFFEGTKSEEEVVAEIQKNTRNYAKRQMTFFKNQFSVSWYDLAEKEKIKKEVAEWIQN